MSLVGKVLGGFVLALLLMIAMGSVSYRNTVRLLEDADMVSHTHEVLEALATLLSAEQDLETGQRGYLVTGLDRYLEPYNAALPRVAQIFENIRTLTSDNPSQQQRLVRVEPLLTDKHAELAETILLRSDVGLQAAVEVVVSDRGKALMDEIRA